MVKGRLTSLEGQKDFTSANVIEYETLYEIKVEMEAIRDAE